MLRVSFVKKIYDKKVLEHTKSPVSMTSRPSSTCAFFAASRTPAPCTRARLWGSRPSSLPPASSTPSRTRSGARGRTPGSALNSPSTPPPQRREFVSAARTIFLHKFRHFLLPEHSNLGESKCNFRCEDAALNSYY